MRWEMLQARWGAPRLEQLLADGWEPFSVVHDPSIGDVVYLRKSQVVVVEAYARLPEGFGVPEAES